MKSLCILLLVLAPTAIAAQNKPAPTTTKVKIEAQETSKRLLFERLKADGKDLGFGWQQSDAGFDYRIRFEIRDETNMRVFWCVTSATVFATDGKELFELTQGAWSCTQATDSIARRINERLTHLKPDVWQRK